MKRFLGIAAALAFFGAGLPASAAVNLIQNGSFEEGAYNFDLPAFNTLNFGSTVITGWTVGGHSIDWIDTHWVEGPAAGNRSVDLSGLGLGSVASQTFTVTPGQTYEVSFLMAGNPDNGPSIKTLDVSLSSSSGHVFNFDTTGRSLGAMGWEEKSFTFVALGSTETIMFTSLGGGGPNPFYGPALDLVSVSAVPEPSTWALMLLGFAGVGFAAWRRAKKPAVAAA
jgi:choice-of-anchor C domain-containing protein